MDDHTEMEIGVAQLRARFSEILHDVSVRGQTVWVTSNGRRVAALVSVPKAEKLSEEGT